MTKIVNGGALLRDRESRWGSWGHLENLDQLLNMTTMMQAAPKYQALPDANTGKQTAAAAPAIQVPAGVPQTARLAGLSDGNVSVAQP